MRKHYTESNPLLSQTRRLLQKFDHKARKALGQHFLIDSEVLETIISIAELKSDDVILEIGPGLGILTAELVRYAGRVIAIELDDKLATTLTKTLQNFNNISIINRDVLQIEPADIIKEEKPKFSQLIDDPLKYKLVANLPYYITAPVLRHFLETAVKPQLIVLMVQKEVAEVIAAKPGKMSMLSVSVQYYGEPRIIRYVPADCFYPEPEVDSAILQILPYTKPAVKVSDEKGFFKLVRAGFTTPRKQIANSFSQGLDIVKPEAQTLLVNAGIAPQRRAETLTLEEWACLWEIYSQAGPKC